jgi:hypothetical protein
MNARKICLAAIFTGLFLIAAAPCAALGPVGPGFDLWQTMPGTAVDLTGMPGLMSNPIVPLTGVPLPGLGNTDTIVERLAGGDPTLGPIMVPIELVALNLRSISPITVSGSNYDLKVISGTMMGEPPNPLGTITIAHEFLNGGTWTSTLPVNAKLTFTEVGNPSNTFDAPAPVVFDNPIGQTLWSHTPGMMDQHTHDLQAGNFYPGIDPFTGEKLPPLKHPAGPGYPPGHMHVVRPAMPEPSSIGLAIVGLGAIALCRRARQAA